MSREIQAAWTMCTRISMTSTIRSLGYVDDVSAWYVFAFFPRGQA